MSVSPLVLDDVPTILEHVDLWNYCIYESFQNCLPTKSDAYLPLRLTSSGSLSPVLLGLWPRRMLSVTGKRGGCKSVFQIALGIPRELCCVGVMDTWGLWLQYGDLILCGHLQVGLL